MNRLPLLLPLLLACVLWSDPARCAERTVLRGYVTWVTDGDTVDVLTDAMETVTVRLYGIDAPESDQNGGILARLSAAWFAFGSRVELRVMDIDRYGRTVALIETDEGSLNESMVESGWAWFYEKYCTEAVPCERLRNLEAEARSEQRGLWTLKNPVPPWKWRRIPKSRRPSFQLP